MPEKLKYLFTAEFTDGTSIRQSHSDISKIDPNKSLFYDVLNSGKTVRKFSLSYFFNKVTVDLLTGLFYVNGLPVLLEGDKLPGMPDKFELIYYRQWTRSMDVTYKLKTGEIIDTKPTDSFCEYFIGWKCEIAGKSYQQKLGVS